ncbi:hypothetical protein IAD21_03477 [Abditibacteriota bacterium]|nr:hypothetical protein IAD21_03477 [Abditibacteriota bacterium]
MRSEVFDELVDFLVEKMPLDSINLFRPHKSAQKRFDTLSGAIKSGSGTPDQHRALELDIQLEHLMQLAKARRALKERDNPRLSRHEYELAAHFTPQVEQKTRQSRCEYCLLHVDNAYYAHYVDYVIAQKHGGAKGSENLALSCAECNVRKGTDLSSLTPSGRLITLFNPRLQRWGAHFRVEGGTIEPLTRIGEVTTRLLDFNNARRVEIRRTLAQLKLYPGR